MRRDLDLVRSILIYVEKAEDEVDAEDLVTDGWPFETVAYHVRLMAHHRLVDLSDDTRDMNGETLSLAVSGLTWDGQDYLTPSATRRSGRRSRRPSRRPLAPLRSRL